MYDNYYNIPFYLQLFGSTRGTIDTVSSDSTHYNAKSELATILKLIVLEWSKRGCEGMRLELMIYSIDIATFNAQTR